MTIPHDYRRHVELQRRFSVSGGEISNVGLYGARPALAEEFDHAAFLGDEGVDAAGFGVEVISDRPLLLYCR